jgi:hypothetical protein
LAGFDEGNELVQRGGVGHLGKNLE